MYDFQTSSSIKTNNCKTKEVRKTKRVTVERRIGRKNIVKLLSSLLPCARDYPALSFQKTQCWSFRHMSDDIIDGGMQIFDWIEPCQRPAGCLENTEKKYQTVLGQNCSCKIASDYYYFYFFLPVLSPFSQVQRQIHKCQSLQLHLHDLQVY